MVGGGEEKIPSSRLSLGNPQKAPRHFRSQHSRPSAPRPRGLGTSSGGTTKPGELQTVLTP